MDTTCAAVLNAVTIDCSSYNIADITGIRYFKHLKNFTCSNNPFLFIPQLPDSLTKLVMWTNKFDSVLTLPSTLTYLGIGSDSLEYISSLPDSLLEFYASAKHLHSLPTLPMGMRKMQVYNTPLYTFSVPLPDSLREFYCNNDSLLSLPSLPNKINKLYIYQNQISTLPPLPDSLVKLYGYTNPITVLPTLPSKLQVLYMGGNLLTSLPPLPETLTELYVSVEQLTSLPDLPDALMYLYAQSNLLTSSPVLPYNLKQLNLSYNQISSIDSFPPNLVYINVSGNLLTTLPPFHDPPTGTPVANYLYLNCCNNQLQNIPKLPNRMNAIDCRWNPDLNCLPEIDRIYFTSSYYVSWPFNVYGTGINCLSNYIVHPNSTSYLWDGLNSMPICLPTNTNDCNVNWNLDGKVELDADSSCVTLNDGTGVGGIKVLLFDSLNHLIQQTYTRNDGTYSFIAPYGPYHIKVDTTYSPFQVLCPIANYTGGTLTFADSVHHSVDFRIKCRNMFAESNNQGLNVVHNKIFRPVIPQVCMCWQEILVKVCTPKIVTTH